MKPFIRRSIQSALLFSTAFSLELSISAQQIAQPDSSQTSRNVRARDRVTSAIDGSRTVARPGDVHPLARGGNDLGRARAERRMDRMILVLQPAAEQQQALEALLEAQRNPESPDYQRWLTPEEFGQRFGASENDLRQVTAWLESQGFEVEAPSPSRREIIFSGTARQVESAFQTEMHAYRVDGEIHHANATAPRIPEALAGVIHGVVSLHDFRSQPQHTSSPLPAAAPAPEYSSATTNYLAPADFATIYDVNGLYSGSIDGTGRAIAVVGRTNIKVSDVQAFRTQFGLPVNNPVVQLNGSDPGIVSQGEQGEATLDVEWAGAVAKKATVTLVVSGSTSSTDGVHLSAQYIVSKNLAPVMTLSFGLCEAAMGTAENQFWNSLWQQAASQGITALVASGDSGAAGCDSAGAAKSSYGAGVNGLCSSPWSTCVGGTQFQDTTNRSLYWSTGNSSTYGSALSYIPEAAWNESASGGLWSTGGGASRLYTKPTWQTGTGVPADGKRDVPDVSLTAASHDGYLIYMNGGNYIVGGTSASTPAMAGIMALVGQKQNARLGSVNPVLYALAAKQAKGGATAFHDVIAGNNSVPNLTGFPAAAGYDLATGLGSVDALVLVNHWADGSTAPVPAFQMTAASSAVSVTPGGASATVSMAMTVSGGFSASVALAAGTLPAGVTATFAPAAMTVAAPASVLTLAATSKAVPGTYTLSIAGSGGGLSSSVPLALTITAPCSYTLDSLKASPAAAGGAATAKVTAGTGCAWTAASNNTWISVGAGASGSGNGTVSYAVAANTATSARTGTLTVAGQTLTVTQAAALPPFTLSATAATLAPAGGPTSFNVTSTVTTAWSAASSVSWITLTSGGSNAAGSRAVNFTVAANKLNASRTGLVSLSNGLVFTVTQTGVPCTYALTLGRLTTAANLLSDSVAITPSATDCGWTAASSVTWITIAAGKSGTGAGTVTFTLPPNTTNVSRTGTLTVAGASVIITEPNATSLQITVKQ